MVLKYVTLTLPSFESVQDHRKAIARMQRGKRLPRNPL